MTAPTAAAPPAPVVETAEVVESTDVVEDLLVEDVSIDGMCGVY
jgi:mycofactocin precursor